MDIAKLAKEAGFNLTSGSYWQNVNGTDAELRKFADLVTAAERERCAKLCEETIQRADDWDSSYWDQACDQIAMKIRAS